MYMEDRTTIQISENLRKELRILASQRDKNYQELLKDMISVFRELDKEKTIISIPSKLSSKIEEKIKNTDIKTVSEYITFLLRMVLSEEGKVKDINEKKIKERLKKLGYI